MMQDKGGKETKMSVAKAMESEEVELTVLGDHWL